jgi:hypothetical protein
MGIFKKKMFVNEKEESENEKNKIKTEEAMFYENDDNNVKPDNSNGIATNDGSSKKIEDKTNKFYMPNIFK